MHKRRSPKTFLGASAIHLLTLAALWGRFRVMGWIVVLIAAAIGLNLFFVHRIFPRFRHPAVDHGRYVLNVMFAIAFGHVTGWVLPTWLWMSFNALAETGLDTRRTRIRVTLACLAQGGAAVLVDGASPLLAVTFAVVAFISLNIAEAGTQFVVELLEEGDQQQAALHSAHEQLEAANEKIRSDIENLQKIEVELRQSQKLEAVGRLASGIAHEINTPTQFVTDSVHFLGEALCELLVLIDKQRDIIVAAGATSATELEAMLANADMPYLTQEMPKAVARSLDGLGRVASIVRSMKRFAHPDQAVKATADINDAVENTLTIAFGEYKYVAELELDLSPLPRLVCHVGELNQVILNLVVNAAHAIGDVVGNTGAKGKITVRTQCEGDDIVISVSDTGTGIPDELKERMFEPFFTTKEVGRGTGQGLAIARSVVERHGGKLTFSTKLGAGSTFFIRLPTGSGDSASLAGEEAPLGSGERMPASRRAAS
jgi:signal transduction histidine kinase